jgi:LysM repeat protein
VISQNSHQPLLQKIKWLTQATMISGALNIGLLATLITVSFKDSGSETNYEVKAEQGVQPISSNEELLRNYSNLSFQELLLRLETKDHVEEGYTKRDLALATLVAFHHFNLEKALGGLELQKRSIAFRAAEGQEVVDLVVFPGLADFQFEAISRYAKTERWPFTSQGLFYEVKKAPTPRDPTLLEAFYLTPEFHALSTLFTRTGMNVDKELLLQMVVEGEWKILAEFASSQRLTQDVSVQRRRMLLASYLNFKSKIAAKLILESDADYVAKRLDDPALIAFIDLIVDKTPQAEAFLKEVLCSPRGDGVRKKAASKLYAFANEQMPEPFDYQIAMARFMGSKAIAAKPQAKTAPPVPTAKPIAKAPVAPGRPKAKQIHVVQEGDNLWKLARRYKVSVEQLRKVNRIESERLKVGRQLEIPQ